MNTASNQPDDMFLVQCAIKNLYKQKDTLKTTARLFERLEKHLVGFGTVIKVEVPELSFDTEDLISEENYNNIKGNDILVELLCLNDEKWTLFGERENLDITFRNEPKPIEKNTDFDIIFGTLTQLMRIYHTIDEAKFKLLVKELPSIMQQVSAHDGNPYDVKSRLGQFFYYLYVKLNEDESFVRLKTKLMIWYREFPWFYFIDEIDTLMRTNSKFRQDESHDINEIQSKISNSSILQSQGTSILQQSDIQSSNGTGITKDTNDDLI